MLREIKKTSQRRGEPKRRWFSGSEIDLYVWVNEDNEIVSYQLTYNKLHAEKALVWNVTEGFSHLGVDDQLHPGKHPGSPLLVEDDVLSPAGMIAQLDKYAGEIDPSIKDFIVSGIKEHFEIGNPENYNFSLCHLGGSLRSSAPLSLVVRRHNYRPLHRSLICSLTICTNVHTLRSCEL
jgi:hypothetical protein